MPSGNVTVIAIFERIPVTELARHGSWTRVHVGNTRGCMSTNQLRYNP